MTIELGHFALVLACVLAGLQMVFGLYGAHVRHAGAMSAAPLTAYAQGVLVLFAFLTLMQAYIASDFSVLNVYQNSHSAKPLLYKISGVWGNHEGSLLLWLVILTGLGALVALFGRNLPSTLKARVLGVQAAIAFAFLLFTILTSNPFERLIDVPLDGRDLNPLLQDPGLAFHPPLLYLGYVGFSVAFSFAVAALLEGRVDPAWARWVRPWSLLAWASLTLGIGLGSWWAYYELGWGGFWFWDPVENASLIPWLAGTALLHSAVVTEKRDTLKSWTILMAILAFSASLLGTFLVRSGVLTSVHAFANDPDRGLVLLLICFVLTGAALTLYAARANALKPGSGFATVSRESALVLNNFLLMVILVTVMLGTFWPVLVEVVTGEAVSVGPPYYNAVASPFAFAIFAAMSLGILLPWKRGDLLGVAQRLAAAAIISIAIAGAAAWTIGDGSILAALAAALGTWVVLGVVVDLAGRTKLGAAPIAESLRRAAALPRSVWGGSIAHAGVGITLWGIVGVGAWTTETVAVLRPGQAADVGAFTVTLDRLDVARIANYETEIGTVTITRGDRVLGVVTPERRWYPIAEQATVESGSLAHNGGDIYVALGDVRGADGGARVVHAYHHPFVMFLWGGALVMAAGGAISLTDQRLRIAAPARRTKPATAPKPVAAE